MRWNGCGEPGRVLRPLALAFLVAACGQEQAAEVPFGTPVSIGAYALTVERTQAAPVPGPPISSFREQPGREAILVMVTWRGLEPLDAMSRLAFAEGFLEDRLSVVDSTGERTRPTAAMQSALLFMNDPGDNWRDWIVLFHVPDGSAGRVLEIENPEPAGDESSRIAVGLGS